MGASKSLREAAAEQTRTEVSITSSGRQRTNTQTGRAPWYGNTAIYAFKALSDQLSSELSQPPAKERWVHILSPILKMGKLRQTATWDTYKKGGLPSN